MGRNTSGVKGIDMEDSDHVIGAEVLNKDDYILIVTEKGYGKITQIDEYRKTHRGSKGVKALNITEKNGGMTSLKKVTSFDDYDMVIVTDSGIIMKMPLSQVSVLRRATQGTRLINLKDEQKVSTVAIVEKETSEEEDNQSNEKEEN